jgi:membrane protease YdiL (CAAX protease family)
MTLQGRPRGEPAAIAFAILFPSLITWIYFVLLRNAPAAIQQGAYGVGKFIQFTFPLLWVVFIVREPVFARQRRPISGFGPGIAFGLSVCVVAWALYLLGLRSWPGLDVARQMAQEKVSGMGIDSTWKYCLMGLFYSVLHSGMEEYYWRWFVFSRLTKLMGIPASIWISSLGFMAHHVIVLAFFFGPTSPLAYLFTAAVAIGGACWAWLYEQSGTISGCWISHAIVDVALFTIGYDMVRQVLA